MDDQLYCISARNRRTNVTEQITGAMTKELADAWKPVPLHKATHTYFRVSKYPFKSHVK